MPLPTGLLDRTDAVIIRPGRPLTGSVRVDGSKNAALPMLAAAAATRQSIHLTGIPCSTDVQVMLLLLQRGGYQVAWPDTEPGSVLISPISDASTQPELPAAAEIRASYYMVPPLLAAYGRAALPWPGGCQVGERSMEQHFKVYEAFGDQVEADDTGYCVTKALSVSDKVAVELPFRSRGASVVAVLRAVIGRQQLRLGNPNMSPEFTGMLHAVRAAGWTVDIETDLVTVGPSSTRDSTETVLWTVPGDKIEAGTLACAVAATGGHGRITGVRGSDTTAVAEALKWLGFPTSVESDALVVHDREAASCARPLRAVASLAPDGLDADFEPALIALALGLPGTHLFADSINPGRHSNLLPQLARLGAKITELSSSQCSLEGPQRLTGATVWATDIRTGSALLVAALTAEGASVVAGLEQVRRGHADLPAKLRALGADVVPTDSQ